MREFKIQYICFGMNLAIIAKNIVQESSFGLF